LVRNGDDVITIFWSSISSFQLQLPLFGRFTDWPNHETSGHQYWRL